MSERPDTIPGRLRWVADWLDLLDKMLVSLADTVPGAERLRHVVGDEVQRDLRADADTIEAASPPASTEPER